MKLGDSIPCHNCYYPVVLDYEDDDGLIGECRKCGRKVTETNRKECMAITPSSVSFWLARLQEIGVACDLKGKICVDFGTDDIIRAIKNLKEEAIEEDMDTDKKYIEDIKKMTLEEVMKEILDNPEYLTDSWYREFGNALMDRGNELLEKKS